MIVVILELARIYCHNLILSILLGERFLKYHDILHKGGYLAVRDDPAFTYSHKLEKACT